MLDCGPNFSDVHNNLVRLQTGGRADRREDRQDRSNLRFAGKPRSLVDDPSLAAVSTNVVDRNLLCGIRGCIP